MKFLLGAVVFASILPAAAFAETAPPTGLYANLGYADTHSSGVDLGAIQGRLGYRFNNWLGVEGELAAGVVDDKSTTTVAGVPVETKFKLNNAAAIYGVGFLPVANNLDLIGRVGYGESTVRARATAVAGVTPIEVADTADGNSWNFGVGAQYHFDGVNGIRGDYTRQEFVSSSAPHADVWSVAYSRRF
ncbi:MAG TPA: porin family protein [Phenylobacterium sp.]|jgi:hypothetical protein